MDGEEESSTSGFGIPLPPKSKRPRLTTYTKCVICQDNRDEVLRKGKVSSIDTLETALNLMRDQAAENKGGEEMLHTLISVNNDLIADDAKYHKNCFASYVSKSNLKHKGFKERDGETIYDSAFKEIAGEISEGLNQGRAYDMSSLLLKYCQRLSEKGMERNKATFLN
eukprot:gene4272-4840_t